MTFAALAGYIGFFHTARYLIFMLIAATAVTLVPVAHLAASGDPVWAGCMLALVAIMTIAVACLSQVLVHLLGIGSSPPTSSPRRDCSTERGSMRQRARSSHHAAACTTGTLVVIVASLDNYTLLTQSGRAEAGDRLRVAAGQALREITTSRRRRRAHSARRVPDRRQLRVAGRRSTGGAHQRRVASHPPADDRRASGWFARRCGELASCPPYELLDELLALADDATDDVRRSGGNAVRYVTCDQPAALSDRTRLI